MDSINDYMFVFYWRPVANSKYHENPKEWRISQPVSLGELIDGRVELELSDGGSLPVNDINWGEDEVKVTMVPPRKYVHTKD
jgi:hypothetical protein